jgi:hypothetical protein
VLLAAGSAPASLASPRVGPARTIVSPPGRALTLARQSGRRVVALSLQRRAASVRATVTVLDPDGRPANGLAVRIGNVSRAAACGRGCYRALLAGSSTGPRLDVRLGAAGEQPARVTFEVPSRWPVSATEALRRAERALRHARSIAYRDRLESAPGQAITTTWRIVAPDRLAYSIAGGSSAVVIGAQRWDRAAGSARWLRSRQEPLELPALPWGPHVRNVVRLDPPAALRGQVLRLAMFEPSTPAWYEVTLDAQTFHLRSVQMVAPSHFMRDTYLAYDGATGIAPPASR